MYYTNYGYPQGGCGYQYPQQNNVGGFSWGGVFAFILVIFILLVIIGGNWGLTNSNCSNRCNCGCY